MTKSKDVADPVFVKKACEVFLVNSEGMRLTIGTVELTEEEPGPKNEQFADAGFKMARASLQKLELPGYRIIVKDGERETGYGLERWIKRVDGRELYEKRLQGKGSKQPIRKTA
jgi:hypothetical protein